MFKKSAVRNTAVTIYSQSSTKDFRIQGRLEKAPWLNFRGARWRFPILLEKDGTQGERNSHENTHTPIHPQSSRPSKEPQLTACSQSSHPRWSLVTMGWRSGGGGVERDSTAKAYSLQIQFKGQYKMWGAGEERLWGGNKIRACSRN